MQYPIFFEEEAQAELKRAIEWYEDQKNALGNRFLEHIEIGLDFVASNPTIFERIGRQNISKYVLKKFPYVIIFKFQVNEGVVRIISIFHTSRNPKIWRKRV